MFTVNLLLIITNLKKKVIYVKVHCLGLVSVKHCSLTTAVVLKDVYLLFQGGMYIFQLMDYYSASGMSLLWVCFFQTVAISWTFGVDKLCDCVEQMMGIRPNWFWRICWKYCAPIVIAVSYHPGQ